MSHQYSLELIEHKTEGVIIAQRPADGFIDATALCKAAGKLFADYARLRSTGEFLNELSADMGIPISELIQQVKGGLGTWVAPQVATHLAQWLSPKFAVRVSRWVTDWMSGKGDPNTSNGSLPYHIERYLQNDGAVPPGHFSILQEITFHLIAPLERLGYTIPEKMVPDISEGRMFCKYARDELGIDTDALPVYAHIFRDGRVVYSKAYPNDLLPAFRNIVVPLWLSDRAEAYFKKQDPMALPFLDKIPALAAPTQPGVVIPHWRKMKKPAA